MDRRLLAVHWLCATVIFAAFFLRLPVLWDGDSYYHLAVARHYVEHGLFQPVPWVRFSLLSGGADKELLFHILLMPFAALPDAAIGGRLALAAFNATIATVVAALAMPALGRAALLVPLWLWVTGWAFFGRMIRLRPELLALLIILLILPAAARSRHRVLALLAFAFALGYTAFHVLVGLVGLWQLWRWYDSRRLDLRPLLAVAAGTAAGLLLRPYPLENIRLWFVQNVLFFAHKNRLDVGAEIFPPKFPEMLFRSAVFLATLVILVWIARRKGGPGVRDRQLLAITAIAAVVFLILFLQMGRMATYAFPLVTLSVLFAIAGRFRERVAALVLAVMTIAGAPVSFDEGALKVINADAEVSELDWSTFATRVPAGARIAATWSAAETYAFWAPQGRYLNVLDPIFMALPHPAEYEAQRRLFAGHDPDVPHTLARILDSEYLALDWTTAAPGLVERLRDDPRMEVVYGGYNALFRVLPQPGAQLFITEWSPLRGVRDPLAGFVDATSIAGGGCATLSREFALPGAATVRFAFAPWGPSMLSIDGQRRVATDESLMGVLARALPVEADLEAGSHRIEIRTCLARGRAGFYLRPLP